MSIHSIPAWSLVVLFTPFVLGLAHAQGPNHESFLGGEGLDPLFFESYEGGSADYEFTQIKTVFDDAVQALKVSYPEKKDQVLRDAHAKSHGCVMGTFQVINDDLPREQRVGVFRDQRTYPAWIRFSNNHSNAARHDQIADLRGMSLKLMGVAGEKILPDEKTVGTQDFLFFGSPVFFLKDSKDYKIFLDFINRGVGPAAVSALSRLDAVPSLVRGFIDVNARLKEISKYTNPLNIPYFSATPYRLGERSSASRKAVKYSISRVACASESFAQISADPKDPKTPNYLRDSLRSSLRLQDACFDMSVQFFDPSARRAQEAIEDPRIEWKSPFVRVARLRIPKQEFDTATQNEFCENLSFTPWHALSAHRPLGRTNRTRGILYHTISRFRHQRNGAPRVEPVDFSMK